MAPIDRDACLSAIMSLTNRENDDILGFLKWEKVEGCTSQEECLEARLLCLRDHSFHVDPLGADFEDYIDSMCETCVEEHKDSYSTARQGLWDDLPRLFGLDPWDKLLEMRSEAFNP